MIYVSNKFESRHRLIMGKIFKEYSAIEYGDKYKSVNVSESNMLKLWSFLSSQTAVRDDNDQGEDLLNYC